MIELKRTKTEFDADTSVEFKFSNENINHLMIFTKDTIMAYNYMTDSIRENDTGQRRSTLK